VTDDRQTDHATEKWVAISEIACARAISPKSTVCSQKYTKRALFVQIPTLNYEIGRVSVNLKA